MRGHAPRNLPGPQGGQHRAHAAGMLGIVEGGVGPQGLAAVVGRHAEPLQRPRHGLLHGLGAHVVGQHVQQMPHADRAPVAQALHAEGLAHAGGQGAVLGAVALHAQVVQVAGAARGQQVQAGGVALGQGQVARGQCVGEQPAHGLHRAGPAAGPVTGLHKLHAQAAQDLAAGHVVLLGAGAQGAAGIVCVPHDLASMLRTFSKSGRRSVSLPSPGAAPRCSLPRRSSLSPSGVYLRGRSASCMPMK